MKKLMIAAAIVCAAAMTQAATFNWGFDTDQIEDPKSAYLEGGTIQLWVGGELIASGAQNEDYTFGSFDLTAESDKLTALADGDITTSFVGQAYQLILTYTDADDVTWTATYNGTSTYKMVAGAVGEDAKNYEQFTTATPIMAGDWTKAVPEPTTGLLMLIGMGALALKRKRA